MRICQAQIHDSSEEPTCCTETATLGVGHLVLCGVHAVLALEGLLEFDGRTADRSVLRDVRARPDLFPRGVFRWADGMTAAPIAS